MLKRVYTYLGVNFWKLIHNYYLNKLIKKGQLTIWKWTYGVRYNTIKSIFDDVIKIWKYCSIWPKVELHCLMNHKYNGPSTYPFRVFNKNNGDLDGYSKWWITIGNDVWIWYWAKILNGIHIGDGAIIWAFSVIARDIPPYAIAVGNPAQIIKYRFSDEIIQEMLKIQWWNWSEELIQERYIDIVGDINVFIDTYKSV